MKIINNLGRPLPAATILFAGVEVKTDDLGRAVFEQVPLEVNGMPIEYEVKVLKDSEALYSGVIKFSRAKTTETIVAELYDLKIKV
ncbi:MAG: hypothetical protein ABDH32_01370 [Candidatus Caldarchaeales archaeon]